MAAARNIIADPYRPDEERVVSYLHEIAPDIGGGDDPIGFLIASHRALVLGLAERCGAHPGTPMPKPDGPGVPRGRVVGASDDRPDPYAPTAYPPNP